MLRRFLRLFAAFRDLELEVRDLRATERAAAAMYQDLATHANSEKENVGRLAEVAAEWRALFIAEKDAHQQGLELLADWQAARLLGRQIFHHAPLLQPEKPATRERVPAPKSGRDRVREETAAFEERGRTIEQTIQREKHRQQGQAMTHQQVADLEAKEQEQFFASALQGYSEAGVNGSAA